MFKPKYKITNKLLAQIKKINSLVFELNHTRFPKIVLYQLEKSARAVSSFASTSIEGNPLSLTAVKKILKTKPEQIQTSEQEVLNYNKALLDLDKKLKDKKPKLDLNLILNLQKQVTQGLIPKYQSGRFRQHPVVVKNPQTGRIVFLPPDYQEVPRLTRELTGFVNVNKSKLDLIIMAGIFHKQMVLIHPFMDGNGRTTRLATKLLLARLGLDTFKLFSFENYYNQNISRYFQFVGERGDWYDLKDKIDLTGWLEYFSQGIISELQRVKNLLPKTSLSPKTRLEKHHRQILKFIKKNSFITQQDYAKLVKRAKATRVLDFNRLMDLDLIERKGQGKATYYILKED
jgi:Fic family protein